MRPVTNCMLLCERVKERKHERRVFPLRHGAFDLTLTTYYNLFNYYGSLSSVSLITLMQLVTAKEQKSFGTNKDFLHIHANILCF